MPIVFECVGVGVGAVWIGVWVWVWCSDLLLFLTYVDLEVQWADECHRNVIYLTFPATV